MHICQKLLNNTPYVKIFINKLVYFVFTFSYKVVKYKHINDLEEVIFMANSTFRQYAREAKSRMLKNGNFPTFVGVIPLRKYDVLLKLVGNNDTLCKMCSIIESGNDRNPITCLIDQDKFEKMTSVERQRYIFRLAEAYKCVKQLYREMNDDKKVYG